MPQRIKNKAGSKCNVVGMGFGMTQQVSIQASAKKTAQLGTMVQCLAGLQNVGVETVFRPRRSTSSYFLLKWGVQIQYLFNQKSNTSF